MRKFLFCLLSCLLLIITLALIIKPERYVQCAKDGVLLWAVCVLPSLLPFFFITLLFTNLGLARGLSQKLHPVTRFLYKTNGVSAFVQIMSFLSGYPVGAKLICELYKEGTLTSEESTKTALFSSTSGPTFILGAVGVSMFNSKQAGIMLLSAHYLSAIFNGLIFRNGFKSSNKVKPLKTKAPPQNMLYDCAYGATISCLVVGTFICIFYVFNQILNDLKILSPLIFLFNKIFNDVEKARAFCAGLIEFTNGCALMAKTQGFISLPLTAFLISFGGVSILIQSIAFLKDAKVKLSYFITSKIIQGLTSFILCCLFQLIFT